MKNIFNRINCYFKGHTLVVAGQCPYTGTTYDYCEKCHLMIPRDLAF